jgi:hypothetical protein
MKFPKFILRVLNSLSIRERRKDIKHDKEK